MPYLSIRTEKKYLLVLTILTGTLLFGIFFTLFSRAETVSAATSHCVIVADNNQSAKYYPSGSTCGSGNGVTLNVRPSGATAGQYTFSNAGVNAACQGIETYALGSSQVKYCVQYTPGQTSAYVARGSADGEFSTYNTDVRSSADIEQQENNQEAVDTARQDAVFNTFGPPLEPLKSKFNSGCTANTSSPSGIAAFNECFNNAWKSAIYTCFQSSLNLEEDQTRGTPEQTEQNHKNKFANCLAAKLNNVQANAVFGYIQNANISVSATNLAANAAEEAATPPEEAAETEEEASSCGIEGIGWIVCPVLGFLGTVTDTAFSFLAANFLETSASTLNDSGVRSAWGAIRNIANVLFVIAFIVIIYSQLTGAGIGNYGVKKMLPRLIIAAVLVNLSLIVCQLAVDLSNLLGYSLKSLFDGGMLSINGDVSDQGDATGNGFGIAVLMVGLLAGGITLALSISMPVILAALLALILIVLILFARTALIIVLTIISPLAFVAFLLPNTEQWFKKWYKMYFALLMVFPVIGVVFGASSLAAGIINDAAVADENIMMQVVAVGVATIPLFLVPSLLKNSLSAAGAIGGKLAGLSSKANGRVGSKAKTQLGNSRLGEAQRGLKNRFALSKAARRSKAGGWQQRLDNSRLGRAVGLDRGAAVALSTVNRAENEEVEQEMVRMRAGTDPREMINKAATELQSANGRGDVVAARAAQKILLGSGNKGVAKLHETLHGLEAGGSLKEDVSKELRADLNGAGLKGKDNALASWAYSNGATIAGQEASASTYSSLSPTELAGQSAAALTQGSYGGITPSMASAALSNPAAASQLDEEKRTILQSIVDGGGASTSGTQQTTDTTTPHQEQNITPNPQTTTTTTTATPTQAPSVLVQPTAQEVRQFGGSSGELVEGQTFSVIDKRSSASRSQPEPAPARTEGAPKVTDKRAGGGVDSWLK